MRIYCWDLHKESTVRTQSGAALWFFINHCEALALFRSEAIPNENEKLVWSNKSAGYVELCPRLAKLGFELLIKHSGKASQKNDDQYLKCLYPNHHRHDADRYYECPVGRQPRRCPQEIH